MASMFCPACGAALSGNYCARCGARSPRTLSRPRERVAWGAAGGFCLLALLAFFLPARRDAVPGAAAPASGAESNTQDGTPPDLGSMTPRERFDRLYNRVMQAAETGDRAEVARFSPMAFAAYGQLDSVDADARYHAAVLHLHVSADPAAALRLADSIAAGAPRHLFATLIRGTAARQSGNTALLAQSEREFLAAWDSEMQRDRPEYRDHRVMLDEFREGALRAKTDAGRLRR